MTVLVYLNLFLAGMLAGEEFAVRYGVRGPLAALPDEMHLRLRQGLIRTLRVLVPAIYVPAFLTAITVAIWVGTFWAYAGTGCLLIWTLATFFGTVPINEAAIEWRPDAPPANWRTEVDRWERLNTIRCWASIGAFALLLISAAVRT